MADTRFTDASGNQAGTLVQASWLNDVNTNTYTILSAVAGTNAVTGNGASTVTVGYPRGVAFRFIPQNTNTAAVTINISGLGAKNITKYGTTPLVAGDIVAGSWAFVTYDGVQFQLLNPLSVATNVTGRLINTQTFSANGTYTPTAGTTSVVVEMWGGGGSGGGTPATGAAQISGAGGGGGGAYTKSRFTTGFSGVSVVVGIGANSGAGSAGNPGSSSTFGALVTAGGGLGGGIGILGALGTSNPDAGGGAGGVPSGTFIEGAFGGFGGAGFRYPAVPFGGVGGASGSGGGSSGSGVSGNGAIGRSVGAGGAGAASAVSVGPFSGGNGIAGLVIVYEYS